MSELTGRITTGLKRPWVLLVHDNERNANVASFAFDKLEASSGDRVALSAELGFAEASDLAQAQARVEELEADRDQCLAHGADMEAEVALWKERHDLVLSAAKGQREHLQAANAALLATLDEERQDHAKTWEELGKANASAHHADAEWDKRLVEMTDKARATMAALHQEQKRNAAQARGEARRRCGCDGPEFWHVEATDGIIMLHEVTGMELVIGPARSVTCYRCGVTVSVDAPEEPHSTCQCRDWERKSNDQA